MTDQRIYTMVRNDFERFPEMWPAWVDKRMSREEDPLRDLCRMLSEKKIAAAEAVFAKFDSAFLITPSGQIARALLDFAKTLN